MQTVKIVRRQGAAALVEWYETTDDGPWYYRAIVPVDSLQRRLVTRHGEGAEHAAPEQGIPYGEDWEGLLAGFGLAEETAAAIANELRRVGIWVLADLEADPASARTAFAVGYGLDVQRLRAAAHNRHAGG